MIEILSIEDMKTAPVGPDELRNAYETLRRFCTECHESEGCYMCKMQGLCRINLAPRYWPEYDSLQYGQAADERTGKGYNPYQE